MKITAQYCIAQCGVWADKGPTAAAVALTSVRAAYAVSPLLYLSTRLLDYWQKNGADGVPNCDMVLLQGGPAPREWADRRAKGRPLQSRSTNGRRKIDHRFFDAASINKKGQETS